MTARQIALALFVVSMPITQGLFIPALKDEVILVSDVPLFALLLLSLNRFGKRFPKNPIMPFVILTIAWALVNYVVAARKLYYYQEIIWLFRAFLIFLVISRSIVKREDVIIVATALMGGMVFQSLLAIWQWKFGPLGLWFLGERSFGWRTSGTFVHPNVLAMFLMMVLPLLYRTFMFIAKKYRYLYMAGFLLGALALFTTLSRGCWIGFVSGMLVAFGYDFLRGHITNKRAMGPLMLLGIGLLAFLIKYTPVLEARFSDADESLMANRKSSRIGLAKDAIRIIKAHPAMGVGLNNYRFFADPLTPGLKIVHNIYLLVAAERGIPGLIIFLGFLGSGMLLAYKLSKAKDPYIRHTAIGLETSLIAFAVASLVSPDYRLTYIRSHVWLLMGLAVALNNVYWTEQRRAAILRMRKLRAQMQARGGNPSVTGPGMSPGLVEPRPP